MYLCELSSLLCRENFLVFVHLNKRNMFAKSYQPPANVKLREEHKLKINLWKLFINISTFEAESWTSGIKARRLYMYRQVNNKTKAVCPNCEPLSDLVYYGSLVYVKILTFNNCSYGIWADILVLCQLWQRLVLLDGGIDGRGLTVGSLCCVHRPTARHGL